MRRKNARLMRRMDVEADKIRGRERKKSDRILSVHFCNLCLIHSKTTTTKKERRKSIYEIHLPS